MPRLFTALELPQSVRLNLSLIRAPINGAKWVEAENMHITLRFAGNIDERTADDFAGRLRDIRAEPLAITIAGVGAFAGREARVLWAGVDGGTGLERLYRANERAARAAGLEPDPRGFKPHVTLARARGVRPHLAARFLEENGALKLEAFVATRFVLLSARPGSGGPPYALEEAFPFAEAARLDAS
jgi:RNA 2',3'-cyclic 3'-phosphodiesterase